MMILISSSLFEVYWVELGRDRQLTHVKDLKFPRTATAVAFNALQLQLHDDATTGF